MVTWGATDWYNVMISSSVSVMEAAAKTVSAVASRRHSSAGPRFCHMDQKASLGG